MIKVLKIETLKNTNGNMGIVAGVISIVAVIIVLVMGAILSGAFAGVATNSNLNLSSEWVGAVDSIGNTAVTSFSIAGLLPIAIVAALIISVISVMLVTR